MYIVKKLSNSTFKFITDGTSNDIVVTTAVLNNSTYTYSTIQPTVVASTGGTAVYAAPSYTLSDGAGVSYEYSFTMPGDGVYRMTTVHNSVTRVHYFIATSELDVIIKAHIEDIICCNPEEQCRCNENCKAYYDYNVVSLLAQTYFSYDIDVNFNYGTISSGLLFSGYTYKCTTIDSASPPHWQDGTTDLLLKEDNTIIGDTDSVVLNDLYTCFQTGTPDDYDGATFTALTDELHSLLKYIADAIYRVDEYSNSTCDQSNSVCPC